MPNKTPIVVFAYNRPDHLSSTLEALGHCRRLDECIIFIYCDGLKTSEHFEKVQLTQKVAEDWAITHHAEVIIRDINLGLKKSIISGVTKACEDYGRVIVLEDDIIVSPAFISFMLESLDRYENDSKVYQVSSYLLNSERLSDEDAVLFPITSSRGWATWHRAWKTCDFNINQLPTHFKRISFRRSFDQNGSYPWSEMMEKEINHQINSWAIRFYYHVFINQGLVVYPSRCLTYNIGFDSSGVHCGDNNVNIVSINELENFNNRNIYTFPKNVVCDKKLFNKYKKVIKTIFSVKINYLYLLFSKIVISLHLYKIIKKLYLLGKSLKNKITKKIPFSSIIYSKSLNNYFIGDKSIVYPEATIENISGKKELISIGNNSFIRGKLLTHAHGGKIVIGDWCYLGTNSEIWSMESVFIGNRVLIAHNVNINDGTGHSMNPLERHEHFKKIVSQGHPSNLDELPGLFSAPIIIEDDVWISFGVTILKGVHIGARSVIAAGSIVTNDVPPDSFYRYQITPIITSINKKRP